MAPKRKSDVMELSSDSKSEEQQELQVAPIFKKARVSEGSGSSGSEEKPAKPRTWQDIKIPGEDEGGVPVYDDCGEVRRKIRLLQKTPGWKVTHWLRDIGGINSNSFSRFMREKGKTDGASNGTYYAAYVYFEKVRILEGKKKTASRINNEGNQPNGFPLENRRYGYFFTG